MNKTLKTLLALAGLIAACASPVRGVVIVNANEVGGNVLFAGGGTFNLAGLSILAGYNYSTQAYISSAFIPTATFGANPATAILVDTYAGFPEMPFGSGLDRVADLGSGDRFGVNANQLLVPAGYLSGSLLSATNTYSGMTFDSLGVTPGSYTWTWGSGMDADSFTLNIVATPSAVPESGSTAFSMLLSLGALAVLGRSGPWMRAK